MRLLATLVAALAFAADAGAQTTARTSFDRPSVLFGETVVAEVAARAEADAEFAPLTVLARDVVRDGEFVRTRYVLTCRSEACLVDRVTALALPPARVGAETVQWPVLRLGRRTSDADVDEPRWALPLEPPAVSYDVAPARAFAALLALAAALALASAVLLALELRRRLALRRVGRRRSALELALAAARSASTPAERRRAAGMIARALGGGSVAQSAAELAWAEPGPEPAALARLVDAVEAA